MTHKHYLPILKSKRGEKWAVARIDVAQKPSTTPLFEIPPISRKDGRDTCTLPEHLAKQCRELVTAWGTSQRFFLDARWLQRRHGDAATADAFAHARAAGLIAIPVIEPSSDAGFLSTVAAVVRTDGRGAMLRARESDLASTPRLRAAISAIGLNAGDIDLLLDYRSNSMTLAVDVPRIPDINRWRTFSAASGVFPETISRLAHGIWHRYPRSCWTTWQSAIAGASLSRNPAFGDYTVRTPGAPPGGGDPVVTMRYTITAEWLVRVGGRVQGGQSRQMHAICADLIAMPEYSGQNFSAGDLEIYNTAVMVNPTPGGSTAWVQWAVSHHLAFVGRQIAALP